MKAEQQHEPIYTPYCYLIGWTSLDKYYYGVRYSTKLNCLYKNGCHPDDLWVTYFTSSKYVLNYRSRYGEPDIIQIRRLFNSAVKAIDWEVKVLRRIKASKIEKWINKNVSGAIVWDNEMKLKAIGRISSKKGKTMQEMRPGWINPLKGIAARERYGNEWMCPLKGKTMKERLSNPNYIDPRSQPFSINSKALGIMYFENVSDCINKTKLDGVSIIQLKTKGSRSIKRRKTTKHIFPDGDIITAI